MCATGFRWIKDLYCNLKTAWRRVSRSGLFLAKFGLRMLKNCYFGASDPNSDTAVGFDDPDVLCWWPLDMYHVTLTSDLEHCVTFCAFHCDQVWARLMYPFLTYNVFTSDILRHCVTLTFHPLTLNVFSVSAVARSNPEPNLSEIRAQFLWTSA